MKTFLSLFTLMLCAVSVFAQAEQPLQFDENNKYVYYKVEDAPGINADTLYKRGWVFAKTLSPKQKPNKGKAEFALNTNGSFLIYSGSSIVRKEAGAVSYTLNIEGKDGRYRYKLSNFIFKPYKRDRFNNMTAQPGIDIPAEKLLSKYSQKETNNFLAQMGDFCKAVALQLKQKMENAAVLLKSQPVKRVDTGNW
ncbi:DUF4468 domain-containing protein [Mucilaginibacter pallidiroseus]|uniref:DUF4468 domain-containing protein n=1 Tax=Mucilaginibacter pallidiroseus TaxID=2599295 RepID=A0A563UI30_9SPHI|nr:DUF4468 domain-containing protein [Mucilaginibacter pallidiroseus]TWR31032.1 DUF4468 domain-containing protein [Mucilaginibacter pallidiroseus]